jgi:chromosome segregation ATPase
LKKFIVLLISFYLYAASEGVDKNITSSVTDVNKTVILYKNEIKEIDKELNQIDFFIKYEQYQKLEELKTKLQNVEKKLKYLKRYRRNKKSEISSLELKKTAYEQQIEITGLDKNNLFDAVISINSLPKPFHITNPFEIVSVITNKLF